MWFVQSKNDSSSGSGGGQQRLDRKESYKAQRKNYRMEKKRVEKELLSTFKVCCIPSTNFFRSNKVIQR